MKKYIVMAAAAIMTISSAVTASAANFYDIDNVPWEGAKEYINSVSDLGLMVGDTDSAGHKVFRAKDRITYCEAMQLAYSILKNTGAMQTEVTTDTISKWKAKMDAAYIPEWAYNCVAYGLETGILSENDITVFMKSKGVNRDATRENVSVIFGKAIQHLSSVDKSAVLTFNDKNKVAATSVPYIELLSRLQILVGDDAGNFNPKNYINRAEMAVMTSKTYYKASELKKQQTTTTPAVQVVSGTVILTDDGTSSKTIAISANETGVVSTFALNSSIPVISSDGATKSYSDIKIGDMVTVASSNNIVVSVVVNLSSSEVNNNTSQTKQTEIEGYLNNITYSAITFDTKDGEQQRYELASSIKYYLDGGQVSKDGLYELTLGRNVLYIKAKLNSANEVYEIDAEMEDIEGEVTSITDNAVYIDFDFGGRVGNIKCVPTSGCEYYLEDAKISETKLAKILNESKLYAKAQVNNLGKVKRFDFYYDSNTTGMLKSISSSTLSLKTSYGRTAVYELDDDAELVLDGVNATYREIKKRLKDTGMLVTVEFDKDEDYVTSVNVKSLTLEGMLDVVDSKRIVIVNDEVRHVIDVPYNDTNIYCEYNGEEISYTRMRSIFADEKNPMKIEAEMNEDDYSLKSMIVVSGTVDEGTVKSISGTSITIVNAVGLEYTYKVEPAARGYINDEETSMLTKVREAALEDGATVRVTFSSRDYVNRIYVTTD